MVLQYAPWSISRSICLFRRNLADATTSCVQRGGSCSPTQAAECPPCRSAPPPPCRAPASASAQGLRQVCCPPPAGMRPPCAPPPESTPRTCSNYKKQENPVRKTEIKLTRTNINVCEAQLDRVARRLEAAERARRQEYENEVLSSAPAAKQPPVSTYRLACERQSMRATDGHDYTVTNMSKNNRRCDSSRTPPPPCPVELEANTGCHIKQDSYHDPCSHQPRIFIEIDRSATKSTSSGTKVEKDNKCENNLKIQLSKRESSSSDTNIGSKNNSNWCSSLPTPKQVPPPCKEPSLIERLRRRTGHTTNDTCSRRLHTRSTTWNPMLLTCAGLKQKPKDKTCSVSQKESQLAEAARGRVVVDGLEEKRQQYVSGGGIDLKIPPATEAVRVRVSLDFNTSSPISCTGNQILKPANNACSSVKSTSTDPWLSIKSLQSKFKGCKNTEKAKESKHTEKRIAREHTNITQNKCTLRPQNSSSKHNNFSRPQTHLLALT